MIESLVDRRGGHISGLLGKTLRGRQYGHNNANPSGLAQATTHHQTVIQVRQSTQTENQPAC
jgi:hypothetical protein